MFRGHAEPFLSAVNAPEQLGLNPIKKQTLYAGGEGKKGADGTVLAVHADPVYLQGSLRIQPSLTISAGYDHCRC